MKQASGDALSKLLRCMERSYLSIEGGKSKKGLLFFLATLVGIILIMLVAHYRSKLVQKLTPPEGGVRKLFTSGDQLVAISSTNEVYVWDWKNLSAEPQKGGVKAQDVTWMHPGRLVWAPLPGADTLVVSDLKGQKEYNRISLEQGWCCKILRTSRNGRFTVVGMMDKTTGKGDAGSYGHIRVGLVDSEFEIVETVVTIDARGDDFDLCNVAASEDGALIAIAGSNNGGWIAVADVKQKKILWEKTLEGIKKIDKLIFSPDGKMLYVGGYSKIVYGFKIPEGNNVHRLDIGKSIYGPGGGAVGSVTTLSVSPNSKLVASSGFRSFLRIWETESGMAVCMLNPRQRSSLADITFSPDSSRLATVGVQPITKIKIWVVSEIVKR